MERWQKLLETENAPGGAVNHPSRSSLDYNTPLRSTRGNATSTPSHFYKLSAELSRESLRIPGAVPFMWEQSPGRRKFSTSSTPSAITSPHSIIMQPQAGSFVPESKNTTRRSLATLFRQPSLKGVVGTPATADSWPVVPISSAIPQISPPPAADQPRSSSARYSVTQRNMPLGPSFNNAPLHENGDVDDDAVTEEDISDALTATAGEGLSVDDSLVLSGALRPASTPSEARDFIMHRFLPAAHTIACESPQMSSRRFLLPVGVGAAPASPATSARSNGSFRDRAAASRPSPLRYASASSTPASNVIQWQPIGQLHAGRFQMEKEEDEDEDVEEEPPITPKACGIFPFHINISFHNRHIHRASPSSKDQHKKQQHQKKNSKSMNCASTPTRIMDILHDDHSSTRSHDDESPVYRLRSKQTEAERERTKLAILERAGLMYASNDSRRKPPFDSYYRESPNLHQHLTAQQGAIEQYNEEGSEYSSFQDAPSRFQSPSPAVLHLNTRASRAYNMQSRLANTAAQRLANTAAQSSRSFVGLQDDHPSAAIISTTEQHLLNSSFYYYNMHTSSNKPQLAFPSTYHTPLSSHVSASYQSCAYHDTTNIKPSEKHGTTTNPEQWDANHLAQKTHIINNALYEHEDQETNKQIVNANCSSMFATYSPNSSRLNQGESTINDDHQYVSRGDQCVRQGDYNISKGDHDVITGDHNVSRGLHHSDLHGCKEDHHVISNGNHQGDHYVSNSYHSASKDDPHYIVINGDHHVSKGVQYVNNGHNHVSNGDIYANSSFLSKCLLSPPLPKSPTHSWLDRAMPLVASTNKSLGASSRLSHMHKATTPGDDYVAPVSVSKMRKQPPPSSAEAPKWEALVKGSHLQPGHLRFSEELYHQSQNVMKVGAS